MLCSKWPKVFPIKRIILSFFLNWWLTGFLNFDDQSLVSDHFVENASFLRIDNISLGYTFGLEDGDFKLPVRFYLSLDNPHVITNYTGIDPEIFGGIDNNFYPRSKTISFGMDINL